MTSHQAHREHRAATDVPAAAACPLPSSAAPTAVARRVRPLLFSLAAIGTLNGCSIVDRLLFPTREATAEATPTAPAPAPAPATVAVAPAPAPAPAAPPSLARTTPATTAAVAPPPAPTFSTPPPPAVSTSAAPPAEVAGECRGPEFKQMDFWIGEWTVRWIEPDGKTQRQGVNRVRKGVDGCAIIEEFDGRPGGKIRGTSVSTYDLATRRWRQTWVDNNGSYIDLEGQYIDGKMQFWRRVPGNERALQQALFYDIKPNSLNWEWQKSEDGGRTWTLAWRVQYERLK